LCIHDSHALGMLSIPSASAPVVGASLRKLNGQTAASEAKAASG
jgi:hypothetical protein